MRLFLFIYTVIFWAGNPVLKAQLVITATPTNGCDSINVSFGLAPTSGIDTIHSISWDFGNSNNISGNFSPQMVYTTPGIYSVSCLINNHVTLTASNLIEVRRGPLPVFSISDTVPPGSLSKFFTAVQQPVTTNTYSYNWEISDGNRYFTPSFIHIFSNTGVYTVMLSITDQTGCTEFTVKEIIAGNLIEMPNVFSPNGDAINDYLLIRTNGINIFSLEVFTRSGTLIYKSISPYLVWDGRSISGHGMSQGIYYYIVKQIDGETDLEKRGFIQLLR